MKLSNMYKFLATTAILCYMMSSIKISYADMVSTNVSTYIQKQQDTYEKKLGIPPFISFTSDVEDFEKKTEQETKDFIDKRIEEQGKGLSSSEKSDLDDLIKNNGVVKEKEDKLDKLFKKFRTEQEMKLMTTMSFKEQDVKELKGKFIPNADYSILPFNKTSGSNILLKVTVPKGSRAAYGKDGINPILVIERGNALEITDIREITYEGINHTKIEAKLISREEYNKRMYEHWTKDFSTEQKKILETYKKGTSTANQLLKEFRGNLRAMQSAAKSDMNLKQAIEEISDMNNLIKKPENKTITKQTIYTRFSATDWGYADNSDITKMIKNLDTSKLSPILNGFKFGGFSDFRIGTLIDNSGITDIANQRILVELDIPSDTYLAHLGDGKIIFPTDYGMRVEEGSMKIITKSGLQVLKMKAKIAPKEAIEQDVIRAEGDLNNAIGKGLLARGMNKSKVDKLKEVSTFDFSGINTSLGVQEAQRGMLDFLNNSYMSDRMIQGVFSNIDERNGIIFQDRPILREEDTGGLTVFPKDRDKPPYIILNPNCRPIISQFHEQQKTAYLLLHEAGHIIDHKMLDNASESPEFQKIFEEEKNKISKTSTYNGYAKTSPQEFFAEVFKNIYAMDIPGQDARKYREGIEKEVPKTVQFIKNKLKEKGYLS